MHVLIYKQLKRAGISTNRIIKHIWESEVQWHVASSPRNMRNAEPARMPRECLPTPENVVPWNATTIWQSGMQQREEGIGPILTIPRTQTLHHFSLHPLTLIAHRDDSPVQHHTIEQKKRKLWSFFFTNHWVRRTMLTPPSVSTIATQPTQVKLTQGLLWKNSCIWLLQLKQPVCSHSNTAYE